MTYSSSHKHMHITLQKFKSLGTYRTSQFSLNSRFRLRIVGPTETLRFGNFALFCTCPSTIKSYICQLWCYHLVIPYSYVSIHHSVYPFIIFRSQRSTQATIYSNMSETSKNIQNQSIFTTFLQTPIGFLPLNKSRPEKWIWSIFPNKWVKHDHHTRGLPFG